MMNSQDKIVDMIKMRNNLEAMAVLEENPRLYHSVGVSTYTLLHHCAIHDNDKMAKYLLHKGCFIDTQDDIGRTPLMIAVQIGSKEVAYFLLHAGANIDSILNDNKQCVIHVTLSEYQMSSEFQLHLLHKFREQFTTSEETAQKLMDIGCKLHDVICLKDIKVIAFMLNQGCSVHSMDIRNKLTALHFAVYFHVVEIVRLLLNCEADPTALDVEGRAPLYFLYYRHPKHNKQKLEILKIFLELGILMTFYIKKIGIFQISTILMLGNQEAVKLVLNSYADLSATEINGKTILHYLAKNRNPGVIEELTLHIDKINVNAIDKWGYSALYRALKARNVNMVEYLLEQGAVFNCNGSVTHLPPLFYAYSEVKSNLESARLIEVLLQYNDDVQLMITKKNYKKITIFDTMRKENNFKKMKLIIAHLAMLEQLGTPITEIIWLKINSLPQLRKYFYRCQQILQTKIWGTITILKLLTGNEKKIALYLNQKDFNLKLLHLRCKLKMKTSFCYYYNIVRKRLFHGQAYKKLKDNGVKNFCKIGGNITDKDIFLAHYVVDYLNKKDLQNLYEV